MNAIPKRIHYDKDGRPEEVVLSYAGWVRMTAPPSERRSEPEKKSLKELLDAAKGSWDGGDGLEYQLRIRAEWDDRP